MEISFYDESKETLEPFAVDLIKRMREYFREKLNAAALVPAQEFLRKYYKNPDLNLYNIAFKSVAELGYIEDLGIYTVLFDQNTKEPITGAKFIDIIELIDKGALGVPRYPIYSEMFDFFDKEIFTLYKIFSSEDEE